MKILLISLISLLLFTGCAHNGLEIGLKSVKRIKGISTLYCPYEDKYGSKIAMSSKMRAKDGYTVAAHSDFRFGTKIYIPSLLGFRGNKNAIFEIQDRGKWIESKKASKGKEYIFDFYVNTTKRKMIRLAANIPKEIDLYLIR